MPPPRRIDPNAASKKRCPPYRHLRLIRTDKPFRPIELSPKSNYSDPKSRSPMSDAPPPKSPFKINRSVTTPVPRSMVPASPDLPPNMDCAFPPFPGKSPAPQSARTQKRDRLEPNYQPRYAAPSPLFAPLSPRIDGGENVMKRMDTIAPGPFDGRRPSTSSASRSPVHEESAFGHRRTRTQESMRSNNSMQRQRTSLSSNASRSSAYSNRSIGLPSHPKAGLDVTRPPLPPLATTSEQNEGIDAFLDRLQRETMSTSQVRTDDVSRAEPLRQDSRERREPPPRPRRPSDKDLPPNGMDANSSNAARSNNILPMRNPSRSGSDMETRQNASPSRLLQPPLGATMYALDTPTNPLHTPSDSGLSEDSYASSSFRSVASSRSSPPGSDGGHSRNVSKISRSDYMTEETVQRTASPESYADSRSTRGPGSYVRPNGPQGIPLSLSPGYSNMPESPMDPAIQMGGSFDRRPRDLQPARELATKNDRSPSRQPEARRPSKGNCRGCTAPIVGKSIKDSSGRLTGRYHKQCFVCRTCSDPFPTAEFYVFENAPYCEQHYHKLNGSLCTSCDRGIEGQYLETEARHKYHPRCFTCTTCRIVLRDDYYEVGGQKFCDRHAQRAAAPPQSYLGPGSYQPRNVQKRRTRLMMMA